MPPYQANSTKLRPLTAQRRLLDNFAMKEEGPRNGSTEGSAEKPRLADPSILYGNIGASTIGIKLAV